MSILDKARTFISRRRTAYVMTFMPHGPFAPYAEEVLADLARFCRANESCFNPDPRAHAVAEGRREVWLRIQRHLKLTDEQLWSLHGAGQPTSSRSSDD